MSAQAIANYGRAFMRTGNRGFSTVDGISRKLLTASIDKSLMAMQVACAVGGLAFASVAMAQTETSPSAVTTAVKVPTKKVTAQKKSAKDAATSEAQDKAVKLQEVTVTGSNIRGVDMETALPTITITREEIQRQGFATVAQLLQNISSAATPDLSRADAGSLGPNQGGSFIDLRGLGAPRTLVLVNGERIGATHGGYTDVSVIPTSIVDHIDVLANGASAVYGSDAVAGVINIVTLKNFNGAEIDTYDGQYMPHEDGRQQQYSVTAGKTGDKGSVVFSASYQNSGLVWAGNRPWSAYPYTNNHPYFGLSYVPPDGGVISGAPASLFPDGKSHTLVLEPGGDSRNIADYYRVTPQTFDPVTGFIDSPANEGGYMYNHNSGEQTTLLSPNKTKNLYLDGTYHLTDNINAHINLGYNQSINGGVGSPSAIYSGFSPNPDYPITLDAHSYYNPLNVPGQTPATLRINRFLPEYLYSNDNSSKNYRYSFGLDGHFGVGDHEFNWDVYTYDSKIRDVDIRNGYFNLIKLTQALGPSFMGANGVVQCGTPGNVIAGCVPFDPLGKVTQQMIDYSRINYEERTGYDEKVAAADFGGNIVELPGGDLTFAVGVQHRSEAGFDDTDPAAYSGYSSAYAVAPNQGSFDLNEGYVEFYAPLLKDLSGAQSLALDVARRWSHYSNFGGTQNNAFKLTWKPFDDLLFRASYSTSFRAPTINDLYQGLYLAGGFTDPCDSVYGPSQYGYSAAVAKRCSSGTAGLPGVPAGFRQTDANGVPVTGTEAYGVTNSYNGGNTNLKPETSYNGDVGLVYSPSWVPGFTATADWWTYNIRNLITGISNDQVLADCYQFGITSACGQFQRQAGTGQIINLMNLETNAGWEKERGWDFGFKYVLPKYSFGQFTLGMQSTYLSSFNLLPAQGAAINYDAGLYSSWRVRGSLTLGWTLGNFGANWTMRYYSPFEGGCAYPPPDSAHPGFACTLPDHYAPGSGVQPLTQYPSATFNDLQVHWNAPWKATFSLGVNNIFNHVGPYIYGGGFNGGTDSYFDYSASYDIGRYVYMQYQQKF